MSQKRPFVVGEHVFLPHEENLFVRGTVTKVTEHLVSLQPIFSTKPPRTYQVVDVDIDKEHRRFFRWWQGPADKLYRRRVDAVRARDPK